MASVSIILAAIIDWEGVTANPSSVANDGGWVIKFSESRDVASFSTQHHQVMKYHRNSFSMLILYSLVWERGAGSGKWVVATSTIRVICERSGTYQSEKIKRVYIFRTRPIWMRARVAEWLTRLTWGQRSRVGIPPCVDCEGQRKKRAKPKGERE